MRMNWWLAPVAVLLVLAGVAGGIWWYRGYTTDEMLVGQVQAPSAADPPPAPAPKPPTTPTPFTPADPPPAPKPEEKRPADSEAIAFIQQYMQQRMSESTSGRRITGYSASLLGSGDPESFIFRLRVAVTTPQGSAVTVENVRVTWKGGLKVADGEEIPRETLSLVPADGGKLVLQRGKDSTVAVDLGTLPEMAGPWGAEPGVEFGVGKEGWAVAVPSLSGDYVLWATKGLHPLLGVSRIKWGGAPEEIPLDLLFEGGVREASWSPMQHDRHAAVAVSEPSGATVVQVWDMADRKRFGPNLQEAMGTAQYQAKNLRWQAGGVILLFDVEANGKTTGPWQYNVATKSLSKP